MRVTEMLLERSALPFDLDHTLGCGQAFRWEQLGDWWYGVVRQRVVKIRQTNDKLEFQVFPPTDDAEFIKSYFRLNDNLPLILSGISRDEHIRRAIQHAHGLRIARQEPWECLVSYICATCKNIPAIKNVILNLAKEFGRKIRTDHRDFYTFPDPHTISTTDLKTLERCRLGYRARYVLETSRIIHEGEDFDLEALRRMDYEEAKHALLQLPGVGHKTADCVLLFALDKLEAFPVDTWIKKDIFSYYSKHFEKRFVEEISSRPSLTPREYREIGSFGRRYFGKYAGYAQEYLFHYKRVGARHDQSQGQCASLANTNQLRRLNYP